MIISITNGTIKHTVGEDGITSIIDAGIEWENSIDFVYRVFKGNEVFAEWINMPVIVEHSGEFPDIVSRLIGERDEQQRIATSATDDLNTLQAFVNEALILLKSSTSDACVCKYCRATRLLGRGLSNGQTNLDT